MINRGVLNGPLCTIYGVTALIISIGFSELRNQWFFLFLGCATISTLVEWCAGHFLEKINHKKWWDYSKRKDGYISLDFSILWGILGLLCLKFVNPLLVRIYQWLPSSFVHITLLALTILLLIDILGTYAVAFPALRKIRTIDDVSGNLHHLSQRLIHWIRKRIRSRIEKAYPNIAKDYFYNKKHQTVEIIKLNGSVELAPIVGLSEVIVDIVETGATLRENGLEVLEEVCPLSARIVVNQVSMKMENERITKLINDIKNYLENK